MIAQISLILSWTVFFVDLNETQRVDRLYVQFSICGAQCKIKQLGILGFDCLACKEPVTFSVQPSLVLVFYFPWLLGFPSLMALITSLK